MYTPISDKLLMAARNDLVTRCMESHSWRLLSNNAFQKCLDELDPTAPCKAGSTQEARHAYTRGLGMIEYVNAL